jgi:hypothetical protein
MLLICSLYDTVQIEICWLSGEFNLLIFFIATKAI